MTVDLKAALLAA